MRIYKPIIIKLQGSFLTNSILYKNTEQKIPEKEYPPTWEDIQKWVSKYLENKFPVQY
jgi:hypothetical protein